ncbi:thioesterase family protein [Virgibacillus salarius]
MATYRNEGMLMPSSIILQDSVREEWIDYNGHMNDAEYVRVFSRAVDKLMYTIGLTEEVRNQENYTLFTLETHVCYLAEMNVAEPIEVSFQMLDYDNKRVHAFFELYGEDGKRAATSEQLLMGIDHSTGKSAPFPTAILSNVDEIADSCMPEEKPKEAGRVIGIRRKK